MAEKDVDGDYTEKFLEKIQCHHIKKYFSEDNTEKGGR